MRKILSIVLASVMLLSCLGLSIAADEVFTTTAAPEGEWYVFEQTIVSEVLPNGSGKYRFANLDPMYQGFDTVGNMIALDRRAANIEESQVKTNQNGMLYTEGDGCWQGRDSDNGFFVYQYGIAQGATKMQWSATVGGQYGIYVWVGGATPEADASKWVKLAAHEGDGKVRECNPLTLEADLTQFEGYDKATYLYVKINDEDPSDGWGGRIALGLNYPITLSYNVDAPAVEEDPSAGDEPIVDGEGKLHEKHVFTVATSEEAAHLFENTGATNKDGIHFADNDKSFTYMYIIENNVKMTSVTWSAPIGQQLHLMVSSDGIVWTDVYKWEGSEERGIPREYRTYDLTSLLTLPTSTIFIKIADSYPEDGWGGGIDSSMPVILDVTYEELTEEEKAAAEAEKAAQEAARLEAEKAAAKAEAQSVVDQLGTLAGYTVDDLNEDNYKEIFKEIRNVKRAYNDLSEQAKEAADEAGAQAMLEAAEKLKADYEAILEAKENEPTTEDPEPTTPEIPDEPDTPDTPDEPEQPADEGGLSPVVIVVIAVVVVAAVVVVVVIATKKKK